MEPYYANYYSANSQYDCLAEHESGKPMIG